MEGTARANRKRDFMEQDISKEELAERIAVVKRFKALLEEQREKFRKYLSLLESQEGKITAGDAESVYAHCELEVRVLEGIASLQKVIVPMQALYISSIAATLNAAPQNASTPPLPEIDIEDIQKDLSDLRNRVTEQNRRNRALLESRMEKLRSQISGFRNPYKSLNFIYAKSPVAGQRIHIEA